MDIIRNYIPVTKAKNDLLDIIRRLADSDEALVITKNGEPEAVLISIKKFTGLLETIEILSDELTMTSIRKSIREADHGKWLEFDEVFGG